MKYDIDYDYEFKKDDYDTPYLPDNLIEDGELFILPNGKYLPPDCYILEDGSSLIYEPRELQFSFLNMSALGK